MTQEHLHEPDPKRRVTDAMPDDVRIDDALRQRFAAERAGDVGTVPSFARVVAARQGPGRRRLLQPAVALGAVAIAALVVGVWRGTGREDAARTGIVLVAGQMRVPTDFLLDLAANTTTRAGEIPSIGAIDWYPLVPQEDNAPNTTRRRN